MTNGEICKKAFSKVKVKHLTAMSVISYGMAAVSLLGMDLTGSGALDLLIGLALGFGVLALGTPLLSIYNQDPEVIAFGLKRMRIILPTYFTCGMMDVMVGQIRGIGYSIMPMIVSLTGACLFRIVWILTIFAVPQYHTLEVLYLSYPASWVLTFSIHMICYLLVRKKRLGILKGEKSS